MSRGIVIATCLAAGALATGCKRPKTSVEFGRNEVQYSVNVAKDDAARVGEHLKKCGYFTDQSKLAVHVDRKDERFEVRFIVSDGYKQSDAYPVVFQLLARSLQAEVFEDRKLSSLLADARLNEREKVVPTAFGRKVDSDVYEFYYASEIDVKNAEAVGQLLLDRKVFTGGNGKGHIGRIGDKTRVRVVVPAGYKQSPGYPDLYKDALKAIRARIFPGKAVQLYLTNAYYIPRERVVID